MKEILPEIDRWKEDGEKVVVATVVATRRSAPRPIGASLAISESGKMCGSVSGGCVESDVFENAQAVLATGEPKLLSYGIEDDLAWSVGLANGVVQLSGFREHAIGEEPFCAEDATFRDRGKRLLARA